MKINSHKLFGFSAIKKKQRKTTVSLPNLWLYAWAAQHPATVRCNYANVIDEGIRLHSQHKQSMLSFAVLTDTLSCRCLFAFSFALSVLELNFFFESERIDSGRLRHV